LFAEGVVSTSSSSSIFLISKVKEIVELVASVLMSHITSTTTVLQATIFIQAFSSTTYQV